MCLLANVSKIFPACFTNMWDLMWGESEGRMNQDIDRAAPAELLLKMSWSVVVNRLMTKRTKGQDLEYKWLK